MHTFRLPYLEEKGPPTPPQVDETHLIGGSLLDDAQKARVRDILKDEKDGRYSKKKLGEDFPYGIIKSEGKYYAVYLGQQQEKHLGAGSSAKAKLAQSIDDDEWFTLKIFGDETLANKELKKLTALKRTPQKEVFKKTGKPSGKIPGQDKFNVLIKYAHGVDLQDYVEHHKLSSVDAMDIALGMIRELIALHKTHFHCDIKLKNFVFDEKTRTVHIIDFGGAAERGTASRIFDKPVKASLVGTEGHLSNVIMADAARGAEKTHYSESSEVFSLGRALEDIFLPSAKYLEIHQFLASMKSEKNTPPLAKVEAFFKTQRNNVVTELSQLATLFDDTLTKLSRLSELSSKDEMELIFFQPIALLRKMATASDNFQRKSAGHEEKLKAISITAEDILKISMALFFTKTREEIKNVKEMLERIEQLLMTSTSKVGVDPFISQEAIFGWYNLFGASSTALNVLKDINTEGNQTLLQDSDRIIRVLYSSDVQYDPTEIEIRLQKLITSKFDAVISPKEFAGHLHRLLQARDVDSAAIIYAELGELIRKKLVLSNTDLETFKKEFALVLSATNVDQMLSENVAKFHAEMMEAVKDHRVPESLSENMWFGLSCMSELMTQNKVRHGPMTFDPAAITKLRSSVATANVPISETMILREVIYKKKQADKAFQVGKELELHLKNDPESALQKARAQLMEIKTKQLEHLSSSSMVETKTKSVEEKLSDIDELKQEVDARVKLTRYAYIAMSSYQRLAELKEPQFYDHYIKHGTGKVKALRELLYRLEKPLPSLQNLQDACADWNRRMAIVGKMIEIEETAKSIQTSKSIQPADKKTVAGMVKTFWEKHQQPTLEELETFSYRLSRYTVTRRGGMLEPEDIEIKAASPLVTLHLHAHSPRRDSAVTPPHDPKKPSKPGL